MPQKPRVRPLMDSQHVKRSERLLKSGGQYFCQIFWWLWKKFGWKNLVLVGSEILRLLFNILTPDEKYSLSVKPSVQRNKFKSIYLQIKNYFLYFLLHLRDVQKNWNTFNKKINLEGDFILKLKTAKSGVS